MKEIISLEAIRDFAVDHPELLIIAADPKRDELLVTFRGQSTFGAFGSDILERALSVERFGSAHRDFGTIVMQSTAKVMNAILDGMEAINETLSNNQVEHAESKENTGTVGDTGSPSDTGVTSGGA